MIGIYKITNKINGKSYVGKGINIQKNFNKNKNYDLSGEEGTLISKDIEQYGIEKFEFTLLEECSESELNEKATYYMHLYNTQKDGYNLPSVTHSPFFHEEIQEKPNNTKKRSNYGIGLKLHAQKMKSDPEYREMMVQKYKNNRPNAIAIEMLDKDTEEVVLCFPKIMDGAAWIRNHTSYHKADYATINKICKGKGKTAYGYKWRYKK